MKKEHIQFLRFCVVGAAGFSTDAIILYLLVHAGMGPLIARVFSFLAAVFVTWTLNRNWTFAGNGKNGDVKRQYAAYFAVQIGGVLVNYACYAVMLRVLGTSPLNAVQALAVGSAFGLIVNYTGSRFLVFRD